MVAFIDVAVADPGCFTYMYALRPAASRNRLDRVLARATGVEEVGCTQENFVPFVFEASDPSARHFLESLNRERQRREKLLLFLCFGEQIKKRVTAVY